MHFQVKYHKCGIPRRICLCGKIFLGRVDTHSLVAFCVVVMGFKLSIMKHNWTSGCDNQSQKKKYPIFDRIELVSAYLWKSCRWWHLMFFSQTVGKDGMALLCPCSILLGIFCVWSNVGWVVANQRIESKSNTKIVFLSKDLNSPVCQFGERKKIWKGLM